MIGLQEVLNIPNFYARTFGLYCENSDKPGFKYKNS